MYQRWHVEYKLTRKVWFVVSKHRTRLAARIAARQRKKQFPIFTVRIRDSFMRMHIQAQKKREALRKKRMQRASSPADR